jgi:2'-5' RNA ligase
MSEKTQLGNEPWRIFCAIDLPHDLREQLMAHINHVRNAVPDARASWSRAENIHLTLKFLGDISPGQVEKLSEAAARSVKDFAPFRIMVEQTGAFPRKGHPRVLWIGINDFSGELGKLHSRLENESSNAGFAGDDRPFQPHLTLARLRQPRYARTLVAAHRELDFYPAEIAVSELLVIRSELSSEGSRYTVISRHPLNSAGKV